MKFLLLVFFSVVLQVNAEEFCCSALEYNTTQNPPLYYAFLRDSDGLEYCEYGDTTAETIEECDNNRKTLILVCCTTEHVKVEPDGNVCPPHAHPRIKTGTTGCEYVVPEIVEENLLKKPKFDTHRKTIVFTIFLCLAIVAGSCFIAILSKSSYPAQEATLEELEALF